MSAIARPLAMTPSARTALSSRRSFAPAPVAPSVPAAPRHAPARTRHAVVAAAASTYICKVQGLGQLQVTPAIKEHVESKVAKATNAFEGAIKEIDVKLSASGSHGKGSEAHHQRRQKVEVTVYTLRHGVIRVEDTEDDLYASVDLVTDKLRRKMVRLKEKAVARKTWPGRGGPKGGDVIEAHLDPESSDEELPLGGVAAGPAPEIVREKILALSSTMTPDEAVDQLENLSHDFYVFVDSADRQMKVVYRRRVHGYGLLIPQVQA